MIPRKSTTLITVALSLGMTGAIASYVHAGDPCPNGDGDCDPGVVCTDQDGRTFPGGCVDCRCQERVFTMSCFPLGSEDVSGLEIVEVECHMTADQDFSVRGYNIDFACSLPGGASGSIDSIGVSVDVAHTNPNFLFGPSGHHVARQVRCVASGSPEFPNGLPVDVLPGQVFYLGTINYQVSLCAGGDFNIVQEGFSYPASITELKFRDRDGFILAFTYTPTMLSVVTGTCCDAQACLEDGVNETCCQQNRLGATFFAAESCSDSCACGHCQLHGDTFPPGPPQGNCVVDIDDLIYILAAFADPDPMTNFPGSDLFPCASTTGVVDIDDVVSLLGAFAGIYDCPHPCPP